MPTITISITIHHHPGHHHHYHDHHWSHSLPYSHSMFVDRSYDLHAQLLMPSPHSKLAGTWLAIALVSPATVRTWASLLRWQQSSQLKSGSWRNLQTMAIGWKWSVNPQLGQRTKFGKTVSSSCAMKPNFRYLSSNVWQQSNDEVWWGLMRFEGHVASSPPSSKWSSMKVFHDLTMINSIDIIITIINDHE